MKILPCVLPILAGSFLLTGCQTPSRAQLFPGVTLYDYPAGLEGKLALLLASSESVSAPAIIYTLDLKSRNVREVARAPRFGGFSVSHDGRVFCVSDGKYALHEPVAFLYSDRLNTRRVVALPRGPTASALVCDHAFFMIGERGRSHILQCDIATGALDYVRLPGTNVWEREDFSEIWADGHASDMLCFRYRAYREPWRESGNSLSGVFSYNVFTGEIQQMPWATARSDDYVAKDGRYVFFDGPSAPVSGLKLVSSPVSHSDLQEADTKTRLGVKVLKRFPYHPLGHYWLLQLSPDRKYAFVQQGECLRKPEGIWVNTYYAVEVSSGKAWPLLKDEHELKTGRQMYPWVYWTAR